MIKKMFILFFRDLKVNTRDFLSLYILSAPLLFAIAFNLIAPGINDTTVNIALVEGENVEMQAYLEDFAKVSVHEDLEALEERVGRRDDVFAFVNDGSDYYIIQQGNESEGYVDFARLMLTFYEEGVLVEDSRSEIFSFDRTVPPLKKMLVNIALMFTSIMGGMVIAMNIIEEKKDKTIHAIHLTPISKNAYVLGKGMMGMFLPLYGSVALILLTGFSGINWAQMIILVMVSTILSLLVGFVMGLTNDSFMDAAGSVKMLFMPMAGGVAVAELVSEKWQWTVYWMPFYWTYLAADDILSYTSTWGFTLMASGIVLGISLLVYLALMPKIRKGLM